MTLVVTALFEIAKHALAPRLTLWQSHGITIVFVTVVATTVAALLQRRAGYIRLRAQAAAVARERSEAALRAFVNALPEPAFLIDANKVCLAANEAMAARLGRTVDELLGHNLFSFVPGPVAETRSARIDEVLRSAKALVFYDERQGRHYANHIFPGFDSAGRVWAIAGVAIDITEVTLAEQRLSRREELLRFGFEVVRMGVWEWDPIEDRVILSPELLRQVGGVNVAAPEGTLASFLNALHPDDRGPAEASVRDCAAGRTAGLHVKYRVHRPSDGEFHWYEAWGRMFPDARGRGRIVGTLLDISADVAAGAREREAHDQIRSSEERYRLLADQLERRVAERTAALSSTNRELESFCYSVSHDLRAPLRSIDGFSQALIEDYGNDLDDEAKKYLGIVRSESQRMGRLIDDLLNLSRVTRSNMNRAPVNLGDLALEVLESQRRREPTRHGEFIIAPNLIVSGDPGLLRIAVDNLLSNAWKFTRPRAIARIEVGETMADGKRTFFVRDNGAGFAMEHAGKLFEPFQRLHTMADFEGSGVGLATVSRVIRRHGGNVWAQAKAGEGATFFWTLPDAAKEA